MRVRTRYWETCIAGAKDRLREVIWWFPFPLLISFGLVLLLTAHIVFGTNPRAGSPADVIPLPAKAQQDSALWFSVTPIDDDIVVTTGDRKVFRWPQDVRGMKELQPFVAFLKQRAADEITSAVLAGQVRLSQSQAVIAADQRLRFVHIRPILYALAEAGISLYAFETQNPVVAAVEGPAAHDAAGAHDGGGHGG